MSELNKLFLHRLEEMWDKEKLYEFVSEQVNWMYEDLQSPGEIKASFLNTFHDELVSIANAMAGPLDEKRKNMTKENLQAICKILQDRFRFDELDLMEFTMEYEKRTGEKIPNEWLPLFPGTMETIKVK